MVGDMDWLWRHVAEKDKQGTRVWSFDDVIGAQKGVARLQLNLVTNHCRGFFLGSVPPFISLVDKLF